MKELQLTNSSKVALIDDEDYDRIIGHTKSWWLSTGSVQGRSVIVRDGTRGKKLHIHRLVMNVFEDVYIGKDVDHIDGNILNNQKSNLRVCWHYQNLANTGKVNYKTTSKYKGVSWHKKGNKWQVGISHNRKRYFAGLFVEEIDAAKAANDLMRKVQGEYARLNVI